MAGAEPQSALLLCVGVIVLIVAGSAWAPQSGQRSQGTPQLAPQGAPYPLDLGFGEVATENSNVVYDEQLGMTFTQDFGSLAFNVTAIAQSDSEGYGPAYLLNGLSNSGFWYQVGLSYNWPQVGIGPSLGFAMSYEVFDTAKISIFPTNGEGGLEAIVGSVKSGDSVLLSIAFSGAGQVQMMMKDWNTGATALESFSGEGATSFVGSPGVVANDNGFFTGLMTEWYHSTPYSGNEGKVEYSNSRISLASAWLWMDELNASNPTVEIFEAVAPGPVAFSNPQQDYPFASNGATEYGNAHGLITGLLNQVPMRITLINDATSHTISAGDGFVASYVTAGLAQTATLVTGANTVEADAGTSVTISGASSDSSELERWAFDAAASAVMFPAGSNLTYFYYDLLSQSISDSVLGGGNLQSPTLTYLTAPSVASPTDSGSSEKTTLSSAPPVIWAIRGSVANVTGSVTGASGERWATGTPGWLIASPDVVPNPILYYHQYLVSVSYSVVGGAPPAVPTFWSSSFGSQVAIQLTASNATGWFDAGSAFSFANPLNETYQERWFTASSTGLITSPAPLSASYHQQYYVNLTADDPQGGSVSQPSGWFDSQSQLQVTASANPRWQFEGWNGSGAGVYTGDSPQIATRVSGPMTESAEFYPGLTVSTDGATSVSIAYASGAGMVPAETTETIFVPPAVNITLSAEPSLFIYSFHSWRGLSNQTKPQISLEVDSPGSVNASSSYNYTDFAVAGAVAALVVVTALGIRRAKPRADQKVRL